MTPAAPVLPIAEPAGAARFTAVSYPNPPIKTAASSLAAPVGFIADLKDDPEAAMTMLEARLTELETVVHALAPNVAHAAHPTVISWLKKVSTRITAGVKKL